MLTVYSTDNLICMSEWLTSDSQPVNQTPFTPRIAFASRMLVSGFEFDKSAHGLSLISGSKLQYKPH